ncbi:MAG TPA: sigma-70 family RNA polymerase sigma factor [Mycobacteriales bacterium]|nr:sigma-70 family RNA polymerase sigma factor [Mycobacteriales bacterium]
MSVDAPERLADLEQYRRELTGYCYRMLGSGSEAEDAVQETMLRAWKNASSFEGRASVRSWLYRIATNVCIDMQRSAQRRARPIELGPSSDPDETLIAESMHPELPWISPVNEDSVLPDNGDPADIAVARDSIRLAFVTALQHLPAKQRAALILCEVLRWPASEAAELLESSVASINSALQRARATLATLPEDPAPAQLDADHADLLAKYVDAFERYDIERFVTLLHEDAVMSMPPFSLWLQGAGKIATFMALPGPAQCANSKLIPVRANGCPAFAQYKPDPVDGGYTPWGLQVLEIVDGRIAHWNCFLDTSSIFPTFGLPDHLPA